MKIDVAVVEQPTVVQALAKVMAAVQSVGKGSMNTQQGYRFRGIDAVVNAVGPAFREHGVICLPTVEDVSYATVEVGTKRTQMRECTVRVRYVFHGPAGDSIECVTVGEAMDSGDKSTPKAMSVAYRVALLQALCIPTDEPDTDSQTYERAAVREEPVWDPHEQEVYRNQWQAEIEDAKTVAELDDVSRRVAAARKPDAEYRISPATWDHLKIAGGKRRGELNGAGVKLPEGVSANATADILPL